jgi:hypothetical protein
MILAKKKICIFFLLLLVSIIAAVCMPARASAFGSLDNPKDVLNTASLGSFAQHSIAFGLPVNALPITENDFILIDMPYFSGITVPTYLSGNYLGTPTFTTIDKRIRITGIKLAPGEYLQINGVTAFNPVNFHQFDVYIRISSDIDGAAIRNQAHVIASSTDGSIVVSATIEAMVGTLRISGFASPGLFITFSEGGTVIGTTVANPNGTFIQSFPGISPVVHTIVIFGTDPLNRVTSSTTIEVFTRPYEITSVAGIILPPTLSLNKSTIFRGEQLVVSGSSVPGFKVIVFSEPPVRTYETTGLEDGNFSVTLSDTSQLELGDHKVYALVQDTYGSQSLFSVTLFFKVVEEQTSPPGPPCDIAKADLNCDLTVNLIDFSILLYYWGTNSPQADINKDGNVNLIDFSIMMFYWN